MPESTPDKPTPTIRRSRRRLARASKGFPRLSGEAIEARRRVGASLDAILEEIANVCQALPLCRHQRQGKVYRLVRDARYLILKAKVTISEIAPERVRE